VTAFQSPYIVEGLPAGYEGEIAVDPSDGTIFRLMFKANLEPPNALLTGQIVVEYGPVELGGRTYVLPVRSVALSQDVQVEWLNDVIFEDYHLFRASTRVLPGQDEVC
jgi:hypothetical protein